MSDKLFYNLSKKELLGKMKWISDEGIYWESATLSWLNIDQISDIPGSWLNAIHWVHSDKWRPPLTQHDGLHVLDDDLPGHGGGAVQHNVLHALPVLGLELPNEVQRVLSCLYLSRSLNRERWWTKCILPDESFNFFSDDKSDKFNII